MKKTAVIQKRLIEAPIDFGAMLETNTVNGVRLKRTDYGFVQFESERMVVFDAYSAAHKYTPFGRTFGRVAFPFCLECMTDGGDRIAYCGLRFGDERVSEWKLLYCGNRSEILGKLVIDRDAASVHITSGVCVLADEQAYEKYRAHIKDEVHPLAGQIVLNGETHTVVDIYGSKYPVFSTGWGEGRYRCYAGLSADGKAAMLLLDFGMIEYPNDDGSTVEVDIEEPDAYVYDPAMSESENYIARWTAAIKSATTPADRLKAYSRRGYAYHSANNIDAALSDYMSAINECKNVSDRQALLRAWSVYDNAAQIYAMRSDYESAILLMNDALAVKDNFYTGAYVRLIELYQLTKNGEKAMEIAARLKKKRPGDPAAIMKYAEVCVSVMDYARAANAYHDLGTRFQLYENLFDEASCLIELGDYDSANTALEKHPAKEFNEQYWYYKAYIDTKKRNYSDALVKAEKSHSIDPEYMPALYLLIDIESLVQEYHAVARYAEEYIKLRPDKEYGYSVCAEAQLILGNFSECSRNYAYLYNKIKKDDKYAALAAITAARIGDGRAKVQLLRKLRRKRSPYFYGALFATYTKKHRLKHDTPLFDLMYKLRGDDDFLLQLAVYLTHTGNVHAATHLLKIISSLGSPSFETVAQQIRAAVSVKDEKLFDFFFDYYMRNFIGEVSEERRALIEKSFRSSVAHSSKN